MLKKENLRKWLNDFCLETERGGVKWRQGVRGVTEFGVSIPNYALAATLLNYTESTEWCHYIPFQKLWAMKFNLRYF